MQRYKLFPKYETICLKYIFGGRRISPTKAVGPFAPYSHRGEIEKQPLRDTYRIRNAQCATHNGAAVYQLRMRNA